MLCWIVCSGNHRIRKITANGEVSTFAGTGVKGHSNCRAGSNPAQSAQFSSPHHIVIDSSAHPAISKFAFQIEGSSDVAIGSGGVSAFGDEKASPHGGGGGGTGPYLYVSDTGNHCIRRIDIASGEVTTYSGAVGRPGFADGYTSQFDRPMALAIDSEHNLYVTDSSQGVRMISSSDGAVWSICGGGAAWTAAAAAHAESQSGSPNGGAGAGAEQKPFTPTDEMKSAVGKKGYTDGAGTEALFSAPCGLAVYTPSGGGVGGGGGSVIVWVADTYNHAIRKICDPSMKRTDRSEKRLEWLKQRVLIPSAVPPPANFDVCASCDDRFGYFSPRRYHCKSCGDSLCSKCCHDWIVFPPLFGEKSGSERVCDVCSTFLTACLATSVNTENEYQSAANRVAPAAGAAGAAGALSHSPAPYDLKTDETDAQRKRRERILAATEKRVKAAALAAQAAASAQSALAQANSVSAIVGVPQQQHHSHHSIEEDHRLAL